MSQIINKIFLKNKNKLNNRKGFTLIELLVVISIIGLLSTVVLASLQNVRQDAKWRAFEKQLLEIRTAVQLYRENNNGNWPPSVYSYLNITSVLQELKNSGVYSTDKIIPPETNLRIEIWPGFKLDPGNLYSCGNPNYENVYYMITVSNSDSSKPLNKTKLKPAYFYGGETIHDNLADGYFYCIDVR